MYANSLRPVRPNSICSIHLAICTQGFVVIWANCCQKSDPVGCEAYLWPLQVWAKWQGLWELSEKHARDIAKWRSELKLCFIWLQSEEEPESWAQELFVCKLLISGISRGRVRPGLFWGGDCSLKLSFIARPTGYCFRKKDTTSKLMMCEAWQTVPLPNFNIYHTKNCAKARSALSLVIAI